MDSVSSLTQCHAGFSDPRFQTKSSVSLTPATLNFGPTFLPSQLQCCASPSKTRLQNCLLSTAEPCNLWIHAHPNTCLSTSCTQYQARLSEDSCREFAFGPCQMACPQSRDGLTVKSFLQTKPVCKDRTKCLPPHMHTHQCKAIRIMKNQGDITPKEQNNL